MSASECLVCFSLGKSVWLKYPIARFAQLQESVLYITGTTLYLFHRGVVYEREDRQSTNYIEPLVKDMGGKRVACLLDLDTKCLDSATTFTDADLYDVTFPVLASSPRHKNGGSWVKQRGFNVARIYMPLWTRDELRSA